MYVVIAGGGKVGVNLARELLSKGYEVTLIEQRRDRYTVIEDELEHVVQYGDATEMWVLERAGVLRADLLVAVTGDDEDNIMICQMAREKYMCERIVARVNNPRNLEHFQLLGIRPAVSATNMILRLIEHEVPKIGLVHLLELTDDQIEIIEVEVLEGTVAAGKIVSDIPLPDGSLIISVLRPEGGFVPRADTLINAGDEVLVVLAPGLETEVAAVFSGTQAASGS
ncbi:MAG: NAD-binding protein [Actinomycetes bacterium]